MKNERVLIADDESSFANTKARVIEFSSDDTGHRVIAIAPSIGEVERLMKEGLTPTVALVDNQFPLWGDGEKAAQIIRSYSPKTVIISFSTDGDLKWGQENWSKDIGIEEFIRKLTELQH